MALTEEQIRARVKALHKQHTELNEDFEELDEISRTGGPYSDSYEKYTKYLLQKHGDKLASQIKGYFDGPKENTDEAILEWATDNYYALRFFTSKNFYGVLNANDLGKAENSMHRLSNIGTTFYEKYCPELNVWGRNKRAHYKDETKYKSFLDTCFKESAEKKADWQKKNNDPDYENLKNCLKTLIPKKDPKNEPKNKEDIKKFNEIFKKELKEKVSTYSEKTFEAEDMGGHARQWEADERESFWKNHGQEATAAAEALKKGPEGKDPWSMLKWTVQVRSLLFRNKKMFEAHHLKISEPHLKLAKTWFRTFKSKQAAETILGGLSPDKIANAEAASGYSSLNKMFKDLGVKKVNTLTEAEKTEIGSNVDKNTKRHVFEEAQVVYNDEIVTTDSLLKLAANVRKGNSKDAFKAMMAAFDNAISENKDLETGGFGRSYEARMKMCDELTKTAKAYIAYKIKGSSVPDKEEAEKRLKKSEKARVDFARRLIEVAKVKKKYLADQKEIRDTYKDVTEFADKCHNAVAAYNRVMNDEAAGQQEKEQAKQALLDRKKEFKDGIAYIMSTYSRYSHGGAEKENKDIKATCDYYISAGPVPKLMETYLKCFREANKDNKELADCDVFHALGFDDRTSEHYSNGMGIMKSEFNETFRKSPETQPTEPVNNEKKKESLLLGMEETN